MHPKWQSLLLFACKVGDITEVLLQTNATLVTADTVKFLLSPEMKRVSLQVSLDGGSAKVNDLVRGKGAFKKALNGLILLANGGLKSRLNVNLTEFRHNFEEIPHLLEFLKNLGISRFTSSTLIKAGRAARSKKLMQPSASQYVEIVKLYNSNSGFKEIYEEMGNIAPIEWHKSMSKPSRKGCELFKKPYISAGLKLFPCVFLPVEKYGISLLNFGNISDALSAGIPLWAGLQKLSLSRALSLEGCQSCPGYHHCASGCMGRAMALKGEFMAEEDRCSLRKAIYCGTFS